MATCFVVCPIGAAESATRKRSNGYLREVIRPVAESRGYSVERADHDKSPGVVTEAIVAKLVSADLVVADLHEHNANVMYEVAIRHASGRPIVQMIPRGEPLPFDIGGLNTIFYDPSVDGLHRWRDDLGAAIDAVATGSAGSDNPVARASLFRALRESTDDKDQILSALVEAVEQLRSEVRRGRRVQIGSSRRSRILLPPDKYVEAEVARFVDGHPALADLVFMLDARDKVLNMTVLPRELEGPALANLRYGYDWDDRGRISLHLLKEAVLSDVIPLAHGHEQPTLFGGPEHEPDEADSSAS